jgi:plastocyanin
MSASPLQSPALRSLTAALALTCGFSACGKSDSAAISPPARLEIVTPAGFEPGSISLSGKISIVGTPPRPDILIENTGDKKCRSAGPRKTENWKISADGGLAEAIVEVIDAPATAPVPREDIIQEECRFIPHVAIATRGQIIEVVNNDDTFHNVRVVRHQVGTLDKGRNIANYSQPNKGNSSNCAFFDSGIYRLECDVHRWMQAWIYVAENDHIAISESDGNYNLKRALKDGTYTLRAWHPQFANPLEQKIEVKNGQATANFAFIAETAIK